MISCGNIGCGEMTETGIEVDDLVQARGAVNVEAQRSARGLLFREGLH